MRIQNFLITEFRPNGLLESATSLQSVRLNGFVFDFSFIPDDVYLGNASAEAGHAVVWRNGSLVKNATLTEDEIALATANASKSKYRVLKNIVANVNFRTGEGTGKNALLIDRVNLYLLAEHSDFIAGLDVTQTPMTAGEKWRFCGHLGIGYLSVMENDSLDIQLYCKSSTEIQCKLIVSTELRQRGLTNVLQYRETRPTGSSQTFENVLSAFVTTDSELNDTISTTDYMSNEVIGVEACIALSNAVGNFEKFKRYGQFYEDEFGVGQTLTFNCPTTNADTDILLCCRVFNLTSQLNGDTEYIGDGVALMKKIATVSPDKFKALQLEGANMFGVSI